MNYICDNISSDNNGNLLFAGQNVPELAEKYGTPLYLLDEDRIVANCRTYRDACRVNLGSNFKILYASKANSFKQIYRIMQNEGFGVDVVSIGEMYTALKADFDLSNAYFHSNNKTDSDIRFGMDYGLGYFVVDNIEELDTIEEEAAARNKVQKILLRLTPGIDPHTYEAVSTGKVDSKFGSAIETGQAEFITAYALKQPHISLEGFHCHIGSQIFTEDVFERASVVMLSFIADMKNKYGYSARELDLGGGYGVRYVESDPQINIAHKIAVLAEVIKETCTSLGISVPMILLEPGRSIVADAGMTVYSVGSVKAIPGYKNYVSIDGGMPDNPRYALYRSSYTCLAANHMNDTPNMKCSVVGRCCESGDIIQENVMMPSNITRGDYVAVCTTGAYNYSMASNYNRICRPPIVMLHSGESYIAVKRETIDDIIRLDN